MWQDSGIAVGALRQVITVSQEELLALGWRIMEYCGGWRGAGGAVGI